MAEQSHEEDGPPPSADRTKIRLAMWAASAVLVAGAAYVAAAAGASETLPKGTTIGGVDVGGLNAAKAKAKIAAAAKRTEQSPITVTADGQRFSLVPATSGLSLDAASAVDDRIGFSLAPSKVFGHYFGSGDKVGFTPKADVPTLTDAVAKAGGGLKGAPRDAVVAFVDGHAQLTTTPAVGRGVNSTALAEQIAKNWPGKSAYSAPVSHRAPAIDRGDADSFINGFGSTAVSGPVIAHVGDRQATISPDQVASVLKVQPKDGKLVAVLDTSKYDKLIAKIDPMLHDPPDNGRIIIDPTNNAKRTYVAPTKPGLRIDAGGSASAFLAAVGSSSKRDFTMKTDPQPSDWNVDKLKHVRVDKVSTFDTPLPGGAENVARTKNIKIALAKINGLVIDKGEQFSLSGALGPLDKKDGYVDAPTIQGGIELPGLGGGLSQVSTTVYNAAFFAGVRLDEHTPHAFWIPRYPMGRESTLWSGAIDLRWTNDTDGPIVIQSGVVHDDATGADYVRVTFYGTPTYTVTTQTSPQTNFRRWRVQVVRQKGCLPQAPSNGFDVTVTRVVKRGNTVVRNEKMKTSYQPSNRVICH